MPVTLRSVPTPSNVRRIEDHLPLQKDTVILLCKDVKKRERSMTVLIALPAPCNARWDEVYYARFVTTGWRPLFKRDGIACRRPWNPEKPLRSLYETVLEEFEGEKGEELKDHRQRDVWLRAISDGELLLVPLDQAARW